jgi:hypothetical protein
LAYKELLIAAGANLMDSSAIWTSEDAAGDFVRLLKQARETGPQEIRDRTGVYVLRVVRDDQQADVAKSLLRLRPKG